MSDIKKISEEKDKLTKEINETTYASGAIIIQVEQEMKKIEKRARENIRSLSLLL